jgi:hypothetical protein
MRWQSHNASCASMCPQGVRRFRLSFVSSLKRLMTARDAPRRAGAMGALSHFRRFGHREKIAPTPAHSASQVTAYNSILQYIYVNYNLLNVYPTNNLKSQTSRNSKQFATTPAPNHATNRRPKNSLKLFFAICQKKFDSLLDLCEATSSKRRAMTPNDRTNTR